MVNYCNNYHVMVSDTVPHIYFHGYQYVICYNIEQDVLQKKVNKLKTNKYLTNVTPKTPLIYMGGGK